ncbi:MAG: hypothetical protein IIA64_04875 [Planctomycetes bacterium]|nr:hypothetical protein [Planctomycetota bacterium]
MVTAGRFGGVADRPQQTDVAGRPLPAIPQEWIDRGGSDLEYFIWLALNKIGLREGVDFVYQVSRFGGRNTSGGVIVDFVVFSPFVGIEVQSDFHHLLKAKQRAKDLIAQQQLELSGMRVEFIGEEDARNRPVEAVREALAGTRARGPIGA